MNLQDPRAAVKLFFIIGIYFFVILNIQDQPLAKSPENCHLRELELCAVGAAALFQNPNGIPITQVEIKRQCEYLEESFDCFDEYADTCLTKIQSGMLTLIGRGPVTLQKDYCDENSELRRNYTKFAPCLKNVQKKHQFNCVSDLQAGFESIHKLTLATRLSTVCCNINRFQDCFLGKIEEECGAETYEFVISIMKKIFSSAIGNLCKNYDTSFEGCNTFLPKPGTKPHAGRNTSAISRIVSSYANAKA